MVSLVKKVTLDEKVFTNNYTSPTHTATPVVCDDAVITLEAK